MSPEFINNNARRGVRDEKSGARRGWDNRFQDHCKGRDPNNNNNVVVVAAGRVRGERAANNAARLTSHSRGRGGGRMGALVLGRV